MTARRAILLAAMTSVICVNVAVPATAQIHPSRPIKIVVPTPAGGSSDVLVRLLGEAIRRANGPTIVVETRPGAAPSSGPKRWRARPPTARQSSTRSHRSLSMRSAEGEL
jgi:tripartite-type tricarboxylate transporter receptor subunit TctC